MSPSLREHLYSTNTICVCILAHNEERNIANTITNIFDQNMGFPFDVCVYANGCTDGTISIANRLSLQFSNLHVFELPVASKVFAWNTAFLQTPHDVIIYSDSDITTDEGTIAHLVSSLLTPGIVCASTSLRARTRGLSIERRFVGLMNAPYAQDFICGGFYAVHRKGLMEIFRSHGLDGIPTGITGEDEFITKLIGSRSYVVTSKACYYTPPNLRDYCRYLARIRWQEEQLYRYHYKLFQHANYVDRHSSPISYLRAKKLEISLDSLKRLSAVALRLSFKALLAPVIQRSFRQIGPVTLYGSHVLSDFTRSHSTK